MRRLNGLISGFFYYLASVLLLVLCPSLISAKPLLVTPENLKGQYIGRSVAVYEDKGGGLSIDEVLKPEIASQFVPSTADNMSFGFNPSALWFRIPVENPTGKTVEWFLECANPYHDRIDLYIPGDKGYSKRSYSSSDDFSKRDLYSPHFIYRLYEKPGKRDYYLRIKALTTVYVPLKAHSQDSLLIASNILMALYATYFGVLIIMIIYNFFIAVSVRERSYFYYIVMILGMMGLYLSIDGMGIQMALDAENPIRLHLAHIAMPIFLIATVLFMREYLAMRKNSPKLNKQLLTLAFLSLIPLFGGFYVDYIVSMLLAYLLILILIFYNLFIIGPLYLFKIKSRPARFFYGAYFVYFIGALIRAYADGGNLPFTNFTTFVSQLGGLCMVTLFSLGLADKINTMRNELADLNKNLEQKVADRTAELQAAMEELESVNENLTSTMEELAATNEQLVRTRDALWGEMQLAKKIQTALLPPEPAINGYEIAARMDPADEVGGDYYDIINVGGRDWIVIGDVSGHGVPAGLVMMMVQTSIQTVLNQNAGLGPSQLIDIVNKTICRNIRMLGEAKYMTITVFACIENGTLHYAGLHQDLLVYRHSKQKVEFLPSSGIWIGIVDEIGPMLSDTAMSMGPGDVMLLFTDGVTEARDGNGEMYSEEKLAGILEKNGNQTARRILDAIMESLNGYDRADDVTLVVVRRL